MSETNIVIILISIIIGLMIRTRQLKKEKLIYYSNYQNALMALSEYDKKLANYLRNK